MTRWLEPVPGEHEAGERSWDVVRAAFEERLPGPRKRDWRPFVLAAAAAAVEAVEPAHRGEERLLGDVLRSSRVVHDQVGGPVRPGPVMPKQRLEIRDGTLLRAPDPGALVASAGHHALTLRGGYGPESMPRTTRPALVQVPAGAARRTDP